MKLVFTLMRVTNITPVPIYAPGEFVNYVSFGVMGVPGIDRLNSRSMSLGEELRTGEVVS